MGLRPERRGRADVPCGGAAPWVASMGPRPERRGRLVSSGFSEWHLRLQWDRARKGAEGACPLSLRPGATDSFNGTAPGKARKARGLTPAKLDGILLQWDRARKGAEGPNQQPPPSSSACFNGTAPRMARKQPLQKPSPGKAG